MSTNTSQNLGLHLWEPTDQVLRTEFNQNWQKIDTAVNAAQETAEAAQNTADGAYCPSNKPYVVGHYTGTGNNVTVTLGFKPSYIIICGHQATDALNTDERILYAFSATGGSVVTGRIQLTNTGFVACSRGTSGIYPDLSLSGRSYDYIAFR